MKFILKLIAVLFVLGVLITYLAGIGLYLFIFMILGYIYYHSKD